MTCWRDVDQLDMSLTLADEMHFQEEMWSGRQSFAELWDATSDRAHWEAGYTAAQLNAQPSRLLDQLRANEQQIAWQEERIAELRLAELWLELLAVRTQLAERDIAAAGDETRGTAE